MIYSNRLKQLREEQELTQYQVSELLNLNKKVYGQYEREYQIMPLKHLNIISIYFNTSIDYLFNLTDLNQKRSNKKALDPTIIGKRLKEFRKENKLTQESLGKLLNTTKTVICGYELGRYIIATPFLYTICKKYNISADYLLGLIDNPKYLS